ncbi:MAG: aldo/keto reductase [Desulfobacteraceae bacterium]|nr:aldo/keto reductase [Desulfobacteraceae bacterium]MBU4054032.1 aldo/keto reductase [Pseudomonadota bacterium]
MQTVKLGKTDILASAFGFGGIPIIPLPGEEAVNIVRHGYDKGITFYDTANAYVDSEKKIGQALEGVREKVVIATKTGNRDADGAATHLKYSLIDLRTDYIDLYQFHNVSTETDLNLILAPGGAYETAENAQKEGKVRHIGITSHDLRTAILACKTGRFATIQFPFNFIETEPEEELFKVARDLGMGIIAMKPLGGGILDQAELCFQFLQQYPDVLPIPGFSSTQEIDQVLGFYQSPKAITVEDEKAMDALRAELGDKFCHRCGYCMPCEQGVKITEVMGYRSMAKRFSAEVAIRMTRKAMASVENCIECGECIEKCPYHIEIPEGLQFNLKLYEDLLLQTGK